MPIPIGTIVAIILVILVLLVIISGYSKSFQFCIR